MFTRDWLKENYTDVFPYIKQYVDGNKKTVEFSTVFRIKLDDIFYNVQFLDKFVADNDEQVFVQKIKFMQDCYLKSKIFIVDPKVHEKSHWQITDEQFSLMVNAFKKQ